MGVIAITGKGATEFIDTVATNDIYKLSCNQSQYSYLISPDGSVIDDIMVYKKADEDYFVVINAANAEKVIDWLQAILNKDVIIDNNDHTRQLGCSPSLVDLKELEQKENRLVDIALQGPNSLKILEKLSPKDAGKIAKLKKTFFMYTQVSEIPVILSRSGYTGENYGYEIYVHPDKAATIWSDILEKGKEFGVKPTGLGARDSTRIEAGFPLYGHELAGEFDITPEEAGYGSFVKHYKPFFIGKSALQDKQNKSSYEVVRFQMQGEKIRAVRLGSLVTDSKGKVVGKVTSCAYVDKKQIGLAYVNRKFAQEGQLLGIIGAAKNTKTPSSIGDRVIIPDTAVVIKRFGMRKKKG
jgi:glycine hydroxymethyltransferase